MSLTTSALLSRLSARKAVFSVEGGRLRVEAPKGVLTDRLRRDLRHHKPKILDFLRLQRGLLDMSLGEFARTAPESNIVSLAAEQQCQAGSIAAGPDDRDGGHPSGSAAGEGSAGVARTTRLRPSCLAPYKAVSAARTRASASDASSGNDATPTEIDRHPPGCSLA